MKKNPKKPTDNFLDLPHQRSNILVLNSSTFNTVIYNLCICY